MATLKNIVKYVVLPFTILLGIIFYLYEALRSAKIKYSQSQAENELAKTVEKFEEKKKDAEDKEAAYHEHYADYVKRNKPDKPS